MGKVLNNILRVFFTAGIAGVLLFFYFHNSQQNKIAAKEQTMTIYQGMICDEPIPNSGGETQQLLQSLKNNYTQAQVGLKTAIDELKVEAGELNKNQSGVCDFKECKANVSDAGGDVSFTVDAYIGSYEAGAHIPLTKEGEATGEPCPDVEKYQKDLEDYKNGLLIYRQNIKDIFDKPSVVITEDLLAKGDKLGDLITWPEKIRRLAGLEELWLTPSVGTKLSCAMTDVERAKVLRGEAGNRAPAQCKVALTEGWYWPKLPPKCQNVCDKGITDPCKQCLAVDPGPTGSVLAKINYKIYGVCRDVCNDSLTPACEQCICKKSDNSEMSTEECQAFLCGESENSTFTDGWVCCHEVPLEVKYEALDYGELFETSPTMSTGGKTISGVHMTAYSPPEFSYAKCGSDRGCCGKGKECPYGCCTTSGKIVGYGDIAVNKADMPLGSWVKIKSLNDAKTGADKSSFQIDGRVLTESNLYFCAADTGGGIHANEIDLWLPDHQTADLFGNMTATVEWFYDPANPCYKNRTRIDNPDNPMIALGFVPNLTAISYAFESAGGDLSGIYFQAGVATQVSLASSDLRALLEYLAGLKINGEPVAGKWSIGAITDKFVSTDVSLMNWCADPSTHSDACAHKENSCHYGGANQKERSYAFDLSVRVPADNVAPQVAQAACQWGIENGKRVSVALESSPQHYHISVNAQEAGCDANGLRSDNICLSK
ncbi:MAG: 3D domain-containing protein [Candidatus Pacebacteria bacterium]|nr:3D domain-containing protein [Candidatus Paceibacterota bacterium]